MHVAGPRGVCWALQPQASPLPLFPGLESALPGRCLHLAVQGSTALPGCWAWQGGPLTMGETGRRHPHPGGCSDAGGGARGGPTCMAARGPGTSLPSHAHTRHWRAAAPFRALGRLRALCPPARLHVWPGSRSCLSDPRWAQEGPVSFLHFFPREPRHWHPDSPAAAGTAGGWRLRLQSAQLRPQSCVQGSRGERPWQVPGMREAPA